MTRDLVRDGAQVHDMAAAVLDFWFGLTQEQHFAKDDDLDRQIANRFAAMRDGVLRGDAEGWRDDPDALLAEVDRGDTDLVSLILANNETGVIFPIEEIAAMCRAKNVLFHTDAVQTPGKLKLDVKAMGVDFMSLSAHKLHAPKGIGLLYVRRGVAWQPYVMGGGQESGRRGGTENVAYNVAFGKAAELAMASVENDADRIRALRDRMEDGIMERIPGVTRNGAKEPRLPNTSNLNFADCEAEAILLLLDRKGICASSGSARLRICSRK